ncbi:MAG: coenzyme F420-0:L-glutamate ligase [Candidatus Thorarchaeota archaeon]|jgi:coenzyme F420-0:L-glutamate ligase/coenzyme F420-1:gamma-L-glutamate ligase
MKIELIPTHGFPLVKEGEHLPDLITDFLEDHSEPLLPGDIVVVTHSIVSVAEGKLYQKKKDTEGDERREIALKEAREIIHEEPVLITRTKHGLITDYSGVDESNAPPNTFVALPDNPDASADSISTELTDRMGFRVPVIITDTQGRPWRKGAVNLAIGVAGMSPFTNNRGKEDLYERELRRSLVCLADQVAGAAELVMGQAGEGIPIVIVRGILYEPVDGTATEILRNESEDFIS